MSFATALYDDIVFAHTNLEMFFFYEHLELDTSTPTSAAAYTYETNFYTNN